MIDYYAHIPREVLLFINGEPPTQFPDISKYQFVCCTDGAYNYLVNASIRPHMIIGDLDSIDDIDQIPVDIEVVEHRNQDYTDFEKALMHITNLGYSYVHIYGSSGGEHDHFLGNLAVAMKWQLRVNLQFFDNQQTYFFCGQHEKIQTESGKLVSLMPFPQATGISTKGLQYGLHDEDLTMSARLGIRNRAISQDVEITKKRGDLLIFMQL